MDHAATMRQFYDYVNAGDVDGFVGLLADDFVEHEEFEGFPPTKEGVRQFFEMLIAAFQNLRFEVEDVFGAGDKAVARVRFTGKHQGEFIGIPASGRQVDVPGIDIVAFREDGKATEHWGVTDTMVMMQQLGVVPEGAPA